MYKIYLKWMLILLPFVTAAQTTTNCFDIQSILVDACGSNEGNNEMVRFLVGPNNLNTANMNAVWANTSNAWTGVCQNATTAGYVAQLNSTIVACGFVREPVNGILPANKKVILVSGINFDPAAASFAGLSDTLYMIFHCGNSTSGNFANVGTGIRNFSMSFTSPGGNCNDAVSYDRSLLPGGNGATVEYTFSNTASYTNYGCNVPITPLSAAWTQPQPLCQGDAPINLNTLITGTPGGTWSGQGVTGNTFSPAGLSGNIAVNYTVGSANCSVEEEKFITINIGGTATWTIPPAICVGNNIADLNTLLTGTTGGVWSGQGVTGTVFNSTGLLGDIPVTYSVGNGTCAAQLTQNINVISAPNASWNFSSPTICSGDAAVNLNLLVTGNLGGVWSGSGVTGNSFSPIGLSGNISVTYTIGSGTCSDTQVRTINVINAPNATWTIPPPVCVGNNIADLNTLLTGTTGGVWSGQGVTGTVFNSTGLLGNIPVTYSVGNGTCAALLTQNINVVSAPNASWNFSSPSICSSDAAVNLNALITGDLGGIWSGTGVTGNLFSPAGLLGNVTVTYTLGSGACSDIEVRTINVIDAPSASWTAPAAFCQNQSPLDLNSLITGSAGGTWSGNGVSGNTFSPNGLNGSIQITYTVGSGTCSANNQQNIDVNPVPSALVLNGGGNYCTGEIPLNLTASGEVNALVTWFTDVNLNNQFGTGTSIAPINNQTQTYYAVQEVAGCESSASSVTVTFIALPAAPTVTPIVEYCNGALPVLTASGVAGNFIWYADAALTNQLGTGASFQTVDGSVTSYFVIAEVATCRSLAANVQIQQGALVIAQITPNGNLVICDNQSITLTSSSLTNNAWSTLATTPSIEVSQSGTYTLTVTGACNTDVASVNISNGSVNADFTASPLTGSAPLTSSITDESVNGDQIIWTINGELVNIISGADRVFEAGEYEVQQLVISAEGCRDSITRTIKSISDFVELLVPNSFTPNGDSKNDTFKAVTYGIAELEGLIFNRWGEQIFQWKGANNGWDGRTNGRMSPDGVYFYLITAKDTFQKDYEKYGSITLLR